MKPLARFIGAVLVGALALLAAPEAQAQVGVNINIGTPAWGPQVPYGTQYYYIPEIDGYYDLYAQQYIVFQDGYWVPVPQLYGYDPYQFHPVVMGYHGREPWLQSSYYHQRYAYQPYHNYGRGGNGYYGNGNHASGGYYGGGYNDHDRGRSSYNDHDRDRDRSYGGGGFGGGGHGGQPQAPQHGGGYGGGYGGGQSHGGSGGGHRGRD